MKQVSLGEDYFKGYVSLERISGGIKPWRIPYTDVELFPPNGINGTAEIPAGVRLAFVSNTSAIEVRILPSEQQQVMDCVVNGELVLTSRAESGEEILRFEGLARGPNEIELFLNQKTPVVIHELWIDEDAEIQPAAAGRPKWITYGSSITQCSGSDSPSLTWPAIVARKNQLDLTCLGYSGNCMMEPMVAKMIRDLPVDYISMCLGINVYDQAELTNRTFAAAVIGMIQTIREMHQRTPIVVISPIISPPHETTENRAGMTLVSMRGQIEETVKMLQYRGDYQLYYVNGLELFDEKWTEYLPDQLHPNTEGYALLAKQFEQRIVKDIWKI
jgi:hypothetical protein